MKKLYLPQLIAATLLSTILATACAAQALPQQKKSIYGTGSGALQRAKMAKTQGANEYQNVHCGLQDKAGNLWFGTTGEGVYRYDGKLFTQFTVKDGLSSNTVWSVSEDRQGNIWLGTDAGLCVYNGKTISYVPLTTSVYSPLYGGISQSSQSAKNAVWSIMQDKNGTMWVGTDSGLYCYNGKTFARLLDDPGIINKNGLTLKSVQCMLQDRNGHIWLGSGPMAFEGICRYDGKSVEQFKPGNEGWVRKIVEKKNGDLLFATRHGGICRYNGKTFEYTATPPGIVTGTLTSCMEDRAGNTWITTDYGTELNDHAGGIWRYNGISYTKYATKEGLTNNTVFLILEDRSGNLWVGTRNIGLYRFNGKTFTAFSE